MNFSPDPRVPSRIVIAAALLFVGAVLFVWGLIMLSGGDKLAAVGLLIPFFIIYGLIRVLQ
jgi:hypothetical protein